MVATLLSSPRLWHPHQHATLTRKFMWLHGNTLKFHPTYQPPKSHPPLTLGLFAISNIQRALCQAKPIGIDNGIALWSSTSYLALNKWKPTHGSFCPIFLLFTFCLGRDRWGWIMLCESLFPWQSYHTLTITFASCHILWGYDAYPYYLNSFYDCHNSANNLSHWTRLYIFSFGVQLSNHEDCLFKCQSGVKMKKL